MRKTLWIVALAMTAVLAPAALRANTIYNVDLTVGTGGSVTGTIVTDGNTGALTASDIVSWNLMVTVSPNANDMVGPGGPNNVTSLGTGFSATATQLLFNYSASSSYLYFDDSSVAQFCLYTSSECNASPVDGIYIAATNTTTFAGLSSEVAETGDFVFATVGQTPEPGTLTLILIGFGSLGMMPRLRKRIAKGLPLAT